MWLWRLSGWRKKKGVSVFIIGMEGHSKQRNLSSSWKRIWNFREMFSTNSNVVSPSKPREKQTNRVAKRLPCQVLMTRHKLAALPFQVSRYMDDKPFETGAGCFFHDLNFSGWCQPQRRRMSKRMLKLSETPKDFAEQLRGSPRFPEAASLVLLENRVYPEILLKGRGA